MSKPNDVVKQIKKATRRITADEKIRIVLEGFRGEVSISDLCRKEGIAASIYYKWNKEFLEAGKNGITKSTLRDATSDQVKGLKSENADLKQAVAELTPQFKSQYKYTLLHIVCYLEKHIKRYSILNMN